MKAALSLMIDVTLISMTHVFIGCKKSQFSIFLSAMVAANINRPYLTNGVDEFDLDANSAGHHT